MGVCDCGSAERAYVYANLRTGDTKSCGCLKTAANKKRKSISDLPCSVAGCSGKRFGKGFCVKHYARWVRHGDPNHVSVVVGDVKARLIASVNKSAEGCHVWQGFSKNGYGVTSLNGRLEQAHRASWKVFIGDIPLGMQVNHKCHNRLCINPEHLYVGTQVENMADMDRAGRRNAAIGERNGNAKLNPELVLAIRNDTRVHSDIAAEYGVSRTLVSAVKRKVIWGHIE